MLYTRLDVVCSYYTTNTPRSDESWMGTKKQKSKSKKPKSNQTKIRSKSSLSQLLHISTEDKSAVQPGPKTAAQSKSELHPNRSQDVGHH